MYDKAFRVIVPSLFLLSTATGCAQSNRGIDNPFFDISARHVYYEPLPQSVKRLCKLELIESDPFRVFAYIESGAYRYYAVWGQSTDEYDRARALEIRGNICTVHDLENVLGVYTPKQGYHDKSLAAQLPWDDGPYEGVPPDRHRVFSSVEEEDLLRQFVRDAIRRGVKAYGGDENFSAQACKSSVEDFLTQAGYPIVLQELKKYCASSPAGRKP